MTRSSPAPAASGSDLFLRKPSIGTTSPPSAAPAKWPGRPKAIAMATAVLMSDPVHFDEKWLAEYIGWSRVSQKRHYQTLRYFYDVYAV